MLIQLFILYQLILLVFAEGGIRNHFKNPPADPADHSKTANDVVSFTENTLETISWTTTFKQSSLALLPINVDPQIGRIIQFYITRDTTMESVQWNVTPLPNLGAGVYYFALYETNGTRSFESHNFTMKAAGNPQPSPSNPLPAAISTMAASITSAIIPISTSSSMALAPAPTTSDVPAVQSTTFGTPTIGPIVPAFPIPSDASTSITALPSSVSSTVPTNFTRTTASYPFRTTTSHPTSSLPDTQNPNNQTNNQPKRFTTLDTILVVIVPFIIVLASIVALFTYRYISSKKGVDAMMEKSMKVQEIPDGFSGWRSSGGTGGMRSVRYGGDGGFLGKLGIGRGRR